MISRSFPRNLDTLVDLTLSGSVFIATSGVITASANGIKGVSLFNPSASGKTLIVYRILCCLAVSSVHPNIQLNMQTSDPNHSTAITARSLNVNSGVSSIAHLTQTSNNAALTMTGNFFITSDGLASTNQELLGNIGVIILPQNTGIETYVSANTNDIYAVQYFWIEQ